MDRWFQSKWFVRILSLIFAISLYLFVTVETDTNRESHVVPGTTTEVQVLDDVPLDIRIDDEHYVVSGIPEEVTLSLEGKTSILTPVVRQRNFTVFVDLLDLEDGEHTVDIEYENIPEELSVYIEPKTISVTIEKRATKSFDVHVEFVNTDQVPLGYEIGNPEVVPGSVQIVSSEAVIEQVAMVKVFVDVKDLKETITNREVPVSVYDIQGNDLNVLVEPASVKVNVPVERPSKTVPLVVETTGDLAEEYSIESIDAPEEVEIFGVRDTLADIVELSTVALDLSKVDKSDTFELKLDFPEGITANDKDVSVKINLNESKEFKNIPIETEGTSNITFINPENGRITIIATGNDRTIKRLAKSDFSTFINSSDLASGEHELDLEVNGPNNVTIEPEFTKVKIRID